MFGGFGVGWGLSIVKGFMLEIRSLSPVIIVFSFWDFRAFVSVVYVASFSLIYFFSSLVCSCLS